MAIQRFCDEKSLPYPPELLPLFVGNSVHELMAGEGTRRKRGPNKEKDKPLRRNKFQFKIPPMPDYGPRPADAGPDWKAPLVAEISTLNLVLYILKEGGGAASSATVNAKLPIYRPATASSTAHMTLYSLKDEDKIAGDSREWTLKQDVEIVVVGKRAWISLRQMRQQDRAALRREVILAALKVNPHMTVGALAECLREGEWLNGVAAEPDMVKGDVRILERDGFVEREGAFWKLKARDPQKTPP